MFMCVMQLVSDLVKTKPNDFLISVQPVIDLSVSDPRPRVIKGQTAVINCAVSGIPFPSITWTKDGLELVEDSRVQVLSS